MDMNRRCLARLLVRIKTPVVGRFIDNEGREIGAKDNHQNWEHLVLFETNLISRSDPGNKFSVENYKEWLGNFMRKI